MSITSFSNPMCLLIMWMDANQIMLNLLKVFNNIRIPIFVLTICRRKVLLQVQPLARFKWLTIPTNSCLPKREPSAVGLLVV